MFDQKTVLSEVSLRIHPKEIVTLIGPNGAGKSTLLKILLGLRQPTSGTVTVKKGLKIGFMPQKIQIDATLPMSVERFLKLGFKPNQKSSPPPKKTLKQHVKNAFKTLFLTTRYDSTRLTEISNELNLNTLLKQPIQQVSGGEMQRILLARALMNTPDLLVLDEPVQGVDLKGQAELYQYIDHIRHQYGCGILMVSHDLHVVMQHTDQVLCLNQHICCSGHPKSVSESPEYQTLFITPQEGIALYEHHHDHSTCEHTHGERSLNTQNTSKKEQEG
ncbi:MAG: metal ABC transporter ATP-binding protein [Thiomicrorhabdus sp.]|nr:metal ABC transporter ATP-binding protein [Thiomicrorhabdus sp.]